MFGFFGHRDRIVSVTIGIPRLFIEFLPQDLPDIETDIHSVQLAADYDVTGGVTLRLAYLFEYFDSKDFELDNVGPDTMDRVLWFGGDSPDYTAHVVGVTTVINF